MQDLSNSNIIHIKKDGLEYIQFRKLLEYPNLQHAFTLKPLDFGGFSSYEKNKEAITNNYNRICDSLGIDYKNICRPEQTHTDRIEKIEDGDEGIYLEKYSNVDGLITDKKEKALVLAFADCTPLLFFDPVKNVIGNIHSGWRGTVQTIGKNAVEKMISCYGCNVSDIICCIGPTIRKCHFEVDTDVKDIFYEKFKDEIEIEKYITTKNDKYYIDTVEINKQILLNLGLKEENIIDSGICTVCNENKIHSYRAHKEKSGRNITIIQK